MTVSDLIRKLREFPPDANVGVTLRNKGEVIQNPFGENPREVVLGKIYLTIEPEGELGYYLDPYGGQPEEPAHYVIRDKERTVFVDIL